jgi:manganese-dependent ADP-ribose/CDP-alcohol diphosphatase
MAAHPLSPQNPQMSSWNGGVTQQQLEWLREELAAAAASGERVIVASHHQLGEGAARPTHMAWNWQAVQEV